MISILTTVYNGARFVDSCFETVNQQRYRDFEWLIVDDGSTDETPHAVERAIERHPNIRIKCIRTDGIGRGAALALGVTQSSFDWIAILDIDDLWHPLKLEIQADVIQRRLTRGGVLCTDASVRCANDEIDFPVISEEELPISEVELSQLLVRSVFAHSTVLANRELLTYDTHRSSQFDLELWLRLLSTRQARILKIDLPLAVHLIHANQNFEGGRWTYGFRSIWLRLNYSVKALAPFAAAYNCSKLLYYTLLPRGLRMKITGRV